MSGVTESPRTEKAFLSAMKSAEKSRKGAFILQTGTGICGVCSPEASRAMLPEKTRFETALTG